MANHTTGERGFRLLPPERRAEIASMGGTKAHAIGKAHTWTPEEARAAALKAVAIRRRNAAAYTAIQTAEVA